MKRKWQFDPFPVKVMAAIWFVVWFMAFFICALEFRNHDKQGHDTGAAWAHSPIHWIIPVLVTPYILAALCFGLWNAPKIAKWVWCNRPLKRVWVNVEDMREHYK